MSKRAAGESVTIDDGKKPNLGSVDVDAIDASNSNALDNDDCIILPPTEASKLNIGIQTMNDPVLNNFSVTNSQV